MAITRTEIVTRIINPIRFELSTQTEPNRIKFGSVWFGLAFSTDWVQFSNPNGLKPKPKPEQPEPKLDLPTLTFCVLQKINDNFYIIDLPEYYAIFNTFNFQDLYEYHERIP